MLNNLPDLTHWNLLEMDGILRMTYSNADSYFDSNLTLCS